MAASLKGLGSPGTVTLLLVPHGASLLTSLKLSRPSSEICMDASMILSCFHSHAYQTSIVWHVCQSEALHIHMCVPLLSASQSLATRKLASGVFCLC